MVSLAGASAAYPGYQQARLQDNQIQAGDITNQNALLDQQGTEALGRTIQAFQASMPGAQPMGGQPPMGPQAPMPGQPSQPMAPPNDPTMQIRPLPAPPQQGGQPSFNDRFAAAGAGSGLPQGAPPPPGAAPPPSAPPAAMQSLPGGAGGVAALQGRLDLKTLMGAIAQANPGAKPAVIASAVNKALPLLNAQAQMDWKQMSLALAAGRLENAKEGTGIRQAESDRKQEQGDRRLDQGDTRLQQQGGEFASRDTRRQEQTRQGDERLDLGKTREARLALQGQVRQDQRWQQLEQQKQALQTRIQQGGERARIGEWRAIVDAQHKRAVEIIQAGSLNANMSSADKKALIDEQNKFYDSQIKDMRSGSGNSTGRPAAADTTGAPEQPKTEARVPQGGAVPGTPVKVTTPEEATALQPGTRYVTPDGQTFTR